MGARQHAGFVPQGKRLRSLNLNAYLDRLRESLIKVGRNCDDQMGRVEKLLVGMDTSNPGSIRVLEGNHRVFHEVFSNHPKFLAPACVASVERHLQNFRRSRQLSATYRVRHDLQDLGLAGAELDLSPEHHSTLGRLFLPVRSQFLLGHFAFDVRVSFFEDSDAVADDDVSLVRLEVDEDDVGPLFLHLAARRQIFSRHPASLKFQIKIINNINFFSV